MPKIINGFPVKFHLDSRLEKLHATSQRIQHLQTELLDRFNSEFLPNWIHPIEDEPTENSSPPSQLLMP